MSGGKVYRRSKFFNFTIKRGLQFRILLKIWAIVLIPLLLISIIFYFYSDVSVGNSFRLCHLKAENFLDFLFPMLLIGFIVSLILGVVAALFFPHAIAGPIYRLERELVDIGKGTLNKEVKFREGDEIKDLADSVNTMIVGLRDKIKRIGDSSEKIGKLIETAGKIPSDELLQEISKEHKNLKQVVDTFTL